MVAEQWFGGKPDVQSGVGDRRTPGTIGRRGHVTAHEEFMAESSAKVDMRNKDLGSLVDVQMVFLEVDGVSERANGELEQLKIVTSPVTVLAAVSDASR